MRKIRGKLTFSNAIACLALFTALGGVSYAAIQLPKNSVGAKQLKKGAVTPVKLSPAAKRALAGSPGPEGKVGPQGPGAVSFEAHVPEGGYGDVRIFNGVKLGAYCEAAGSAGIAFYATGPGNTLEVSGTANRFEPEEATVPFGTGGGPSSSTSMSDGSGQIDVDVIARDTSVSAAFGRFDVHLARPTCVLQGTYTPSAVG